MRDYPALHRIFKNEHTSYHKFSMKRSMACSGVVLFSCGVKHYI